MRSITGRLWLDCTSRGIPINTERAAKITKAVCSHVTDIVTCDQLKRGTSFLRYATIMAMANATSTKHASYYSKHVPRGCILPFQMNMFTESFVHTLRGQLSKGMSLACTTSLTNCPRWDPRYLAILENKMVKCKFDHLSYSY